MADSKPGKLQGDEVTSNVTFNVYPKDDRGTDGIFKDKVEKYGDVGDTRRGK